MYNLNMNVNPSPTFAAGLLGVAAGEVTPRTPEIINSLIAMNNPFENYCNEKSRDRTDSTSSGEPSPPSVQFTCSQLIKEGLKLTLETKRRANCDYYEGKKKSKKEDRSADDEEDYDSSSNNNNTKIHGLTHEDEERRRKRRERNKIAATKCRLKKREKTVILVQEYEILETKKHDLNSQIQELETEKRRLEEMLRVHNLTCSINTGTLDTSYTQYTETIPLPSYQDNFASPPNCLPKYSSSVKLENLEPTARDFYQHGSPYLSTSDSGCTV